MINFKPDYVEEITIQVPPDRSYLYKDTNSEGDEESKSIDFED